MTHNLESSETLIAQYKEQMPTFLFYCGSRASDYGLMKINEEGQVLFFKEKPKGAELQAMQVDTTVLGLSPEEAKKKPYIASMGIYVFKKDVLLKLLRWRYPTANDFGSEIIPDAAKELSMQAYLFDDYWEDIGTIKSFFDANLALTAQPPNFSFYDAAKPIFTSPRFLPPTKIEKCQVRDSIISHGCFLRSCSVEHSIVGVRSRIEDGVTLKVSMICIECQVLSISWMFGECISILCPFTKRIPQEKLLVLCGLFLDGILCIYGLAT
jgi:glucose-1-phosphate adenylyltransferase